MRCVIWLLYVASLQCVRRPCSPIELLMSSHWLPHSPNQSPPLCLDRFFELQFIFFGCRPPTFSRCRLRRHCWRLAAPGSRPVGRGASSCCLGHADPREHGQVLEGGRVPPLRSAMLLGDIRARCAGLLGVLQVQGPRAEADIPLWPDRSHRLPRSLVAAGTLV